MCSDLSFKAENVEWVNDYLPNLVIENSTQYTIAPVLQVQAHVFPVYPIIFIQKEEPQLHFFEWGLIADYMNTAEKIKQYRTSMVNARSEKLLQDPQSVWYKLRQQRCLIPTTGFFEHRAIKGWKKKVPYHISFANKQPFFLLGMYHYSPMPDMLTGESKGTFTLLTQSANTLMCQIHNDGPNKHRMPVLIEPSKAIEWLNPSVDLVTLSSMLSEKIPDNSLLAYPVYTIRTNQERPDGMLLTDPYQWQGLPPLGLDSLPTLF